MDEITLLIVEDHETLRTSLSSWLKDIYPNLNIHCSDNGENGIVIMNRIKPRIMIVDIGLPGIDGIEVTKLTRRFSPETHVIVLTMLDGANYESESLEAGAYSFMNKKEMYSKLPHLINSVLSSQHN